MNILKAGRDKDMMNMWMWNLAFHCVVNIGVRGSENVRTRVVEADMVPVIATILDNYIQVFDKVRSKAEANAKKNVPNGTGRTRERDPHKHSDRSERAANSERRRQASALSNIEIPIPYPRAQHASDHIELDITAPTLPFLPPNRHQHSHSRTHDHGSHLLPLRPTRTSNNTQPSQPLLAPAPAPPPNSDVADVYVPLRPVRDADRLPSMLLGTGTMRPESPTTPNPHITIVTTRGTRRSGRPSIRHQRSMSGESDDANSEEIATDGPNNTEPIVDIQGNLDTMDGQAVLEPVDTQMGADNQDADTFNITHRSPLDGSIINPTTVVNPAMGFSPVPTITAPPVIPLPNYPRILSENSSSSVMLPSMPREEDVLLSLQLLAYVSKYCNLRTYFQKSHLVPALSISNEIHLLDEDPSVAKQHIPEPPMEEYLMDDNFNIFPLVEKFTVRHHPGEMQYWAGVVMRNLCRKDDTRGGIRQCAYYECGKWEQYTRQFAKCRRCRRTKYCSKECQKSAWVYHRHWCVAAAQQ